MMKFSVRSQLASLLMLLLTVPAFAQSEKRLSILDFGAQPGATDSRQAIQKCLDEAVKTGATCFVPEGLFTVHGDLWLADNARLVGVNPQSTLHFTAGTLRAEKNGRRDFHYTNNYLNEVVPGRQRTPLTRAASVGESVIHVTEADRYAPGETVRLFNGRKDTWAILEDKAHETLWNNPQGPFAHGEIFRILKVEGQTITLDRPLTFDMPEGAPFEKMAGARNVLVEDLRIVNFAAPQSIHFEQPQQATIRRVWIEGNGGITLSHYAFENVIEGNSIHAANARAITLEYFAARNIVRENVVSYTRGGDCAVLVMVNSSFNQILNNDVYCYGKQQANEGGIYIHVTSFQNRVIGNRVRGSTDGLGVFYGAYDNHFEGNVVTQTRTGLTGWYAGPNNVFEDNRVTVGSTRPGPMVGSYIHGSQQQIFRRNRANGPMEKQVWIEKSDPLVLEGNVNLALHKP